MTPQKAFLSFRSEIRNSWKKKKRCILFSSVATRVLPDCNDLLWFCFLESWVGSGAFLSLLCRCHSVSFFGEPSLVLSLRYRSTGALSTWLCQPVAGHKAVPHLLQMTLWTTQITIIAFISLERVQIGIYLKLYIKLLSGASFAASPEETTALQTSFWACSCKLSCFLLFPRNPDFLYPPSNGSVIFGDIEFICYCNSRNIVSHCRKAPFAHLFVNFSVCRWLKSSILFAEKSKRKLLTTHYFNIKYPNFLNNA